MDLYNLMIALANSANLKDSDIKVFDLNTDEGLKGYNEQLDILENSDLDILKAFGIDSKKWINNMRNIGKQIHDANQKKDNKKELIKESVKQMSRKEEDHTIEDIDDEDLLDFDDEEPKESTKFIRPSELLNVSQKLQLHKIVQEYVDTMIKPYNKGALTTQQINDAYAGLYEFAAWVMNK